MAYQSVQEFADNCGVTKSYLSVAIGRGNVVVADGFIDDTNAKNVKYLHKRLASAAKKGTLKSKPAVSRAGTEAKAQPEAGAKKAAKETEGDRAAKMVMQKMQYELDRTEQQIRILKLDAEKKEGSVVPIDLCEMVVLQFSKATMTAYKNWGEDYLLKMSKKYDMTNKDITDSRLLLIDTINAAIAENVKIAQGQVGSIAKEYSAQRGVGRKT